MAADEELFLHSNEFSSTSVFHRRAMGQVIFLRTRSGEGRRSGLVPLQHTSFTDFPGTRTGSSAGYHDNIPPVALTNISTWEILLCKNSVLKDRSSVRSRRRVACCRWFGYHCIDVNLIKRGHAIITLRILVALTIGKDTAGKPTGKTMKRKAYTTFAFIAINVRCYAQLNRKH